MSPEREKDGAFGKEGFRGMCWKPEKLYSDVYTDALSQHALAAFMKSGELERHIWKMKKSYRRKREGLIRCLASCFGERFSIGGEAARLHLVAGFAGIDFTAGLAGELYARGIRVVPVENYFLCRDGSHAHEIILGYSHLTDAEISKGVEILSGVIG